MSQAAAEKVRISVLVPTLNEERNLDACLASVDWADEVIVYDSFSTDGTLAIAERHGARVEQRVFDDFATHKNWALDNIDFANDWIFILDADERATPDLAAEIRAVVVDPDAHPGHYIARRNIFAGKWIRRANMYPDHQLRVFRRGHCRYEKRVVHEHMVCDGPTGILKSPVEHRDYKGIERYVARHNTYSSLEAVAVTRWMRGLDDEELASDLFGTGPERKRAIKQFAYRHLPGRPFFYFLWMYIIRLGFLDGRIGLRYCLLRFSYELQVDLKLKELKDPDSPMARQYAGLLRAERTGGPACPDCGGQTHLLAAGLFDTRFGIDRRMDVRRCSECGLAVSDPIPSDAELTELYTEHYNFKGVRTGRYEDIREAVFASPLYRLWAWLDSDISFHLRRGNGRLLEIGCNEGRNLGFYRRSGFSAEGQEINPVAAAAARDAGFVVHESTIENLHPETAYDVVVLSQVLEHATDPNAMLSEARRLLAPGGEIWISCPNVDSWAAGLFTKGWVNWHVPFHITHFDARALARTVERAGFEVVEQDQQTPGLWVALSALGRFTSKPGQANGLMRNAPLMMILLATIRGGLFPLLWLGNRMGRGDCLRLIARARP